MLVLGIETSCDETAASLVRSGREVLSNVVYSQVAAHQPFGGVVPEVASRHHVEHLPGIIEQSFSDTSIDWPDVDAIAVTYGPGLASSLLVGLSAAKALALRLGKPLLAVNHLEAHLYSVFMGKDAPDVRDVAPLLTLLVTGGHTCLVLVRGIGSYRLLGQTLDDAAGEALDKGAKLLGLGYPGGPVIEEAARNGKRDAVPFPRGLKGAARDVEVNGMRKDLCFSFSGLKTALLYHLKSNPDAGEGDGLKDTAASYQEAVFDTLLNRVEKALGEEDVRHFACVGGVARNARLRDKLTSMGKRQRVEVHMAAPEFCTDNAAMVAGLAGTRAPGTAVPGSHVDVSPNLAISGDEHRS